MSSSPTKMTSSRKIRMTTTSWYMRVNCKSFKLPDREKRWSLTMQRAFSGIGRWDCRDRNITQVYLHWQSVEAIDTTLTCEHLQNHPVTMASKWKRLRHYALFAKDSYLILSVLNHSDTLKTSERERERDVMNDPSIQSTTSKWSTVGFSDDLWVRRVRIWFLFLRVVLWMNL